MEPRDLLPWRRFVLETSWSPAVAIAALEKQIDPPRLFDLFDLDGSLPFIGKTTSATQLRFRRRVSYNNSVRPRITVNVEPTASTRLDVTMRLHGPVAAIMTMWITGATVVSVSVAVSALASGKFGGLLPLAFPIFGMALTSIPFAIEARKAERMLRETYASAPPLPPPVVSGPYR